MNDVATAGKMPAVELGTTKAAITRLKKKFPAAKVPDAGTKAGMLEIKGVLRELVPLRTGIEKRRQELVSDAVAWQKKVNTEASTLKDSIAAIEKPYRDAKEAEEAAETKRKQEAKEKEEHRIAEIEGKVNSIYALTEGLLGADLATLEERLKTTEAIKITDEEYMEFVEPASIALQTTKNQLTNAVTTTRETEIQREQLREQQAGMAEQQRKLDEQQAEIDRQKQEQDERDEEARRAKEKEAREKREREAEEQRQAQMKARMPEDIKLRNYVDDLLEVQQPEMVDEGLNTVINMIIERLLKIRDYAYAATQEPDV